MKHLVLLTALSLFLGGCLKSMGELRTNSDSPRRSAPQKEVKAPPAGFKFEEYDEQLRQLSGRLDVIENHVSQLNAAHRGEKDDIAREKKELSQKFVAYEEELKKLEIQMASLHEELNRLKQPAPTASSSKKSSFEEAEQLFEAKKWKEAIVAFQKYRDANPKGKKYSEATFKIGACFQELGMKDEAKTFYTEVTTKFPKSKDSKKAASRLKALK